MFGTKTRRGMAASALVVSLSLTTLVGSAAASPSAEDARGCSVLAHERNAGVHRLHEAWRGFNDQLRDLSREARDLSRESRRSGSATELTVDARADIADAKSELNAIRSTAHAELQDRVELGTVCKDPVVTESEDPHMTLAALVDTETNDEDGTVTLTFSVQFNEEVTCSTETDNGAACKSLFTYVANGDEDTTAVDAKTFELSDDGTMATLTFELDEDVEVDGSADELKLTSGGSNSLKDTDAEANVMDTDTEMTVELSLQTNDLVKKYREVVDQAIKDMQAVMDPLNAAVAEMLEAAATAETTDDAAVTEKHGKAKADRETKKSGKPEGAGKPTDKGGKGKAPRG
jgi:hypothetical protein